MRSPAGSRGSKPLPPLADRKASLLLPSMTEPASMPSHTPIVESESTELSSPRNSQANAARPNILFLTMDAPAIRGTGGQVRSYHFADSLAKMSDLTLVSLGGGDGQTPVEPALAASCRQVIQPCDLVAASGVPPGGGKSRLQSWGHANTTLAFPWRNRWRSFLHFCVQYGPSSPGSSGEREPWTRKLLASWLRCQMAILSRWCAIPPLKVFHFSGAFDRVLPAVVSATSESDFDLIFFEHSFTYPFAQQLHRRFPSAALICNAHNVEWILEDRVAELISEPTAKRFHLAQVRLLRALETKAFLASELILACSEEDRTQIAKLAPETPVHVIGNGVDTDYFRPPEPRTLSPKPTLLFTGGFGYGPNLDGLQFFLEEIFPLIIKSQPSCRFRFAGFAAQRALERLDIEDDRIECISSPEDIRPCFHDAWVYVVPLRAGGGTRLKILEAMAMELPIVSTRIGAEGIPAEGGLHFFLADTPTDFARQVCHLIEGKPLRDRASRAAGTWVRNRYDWGYLIEELPSLIRQVIDRKVPT